MAGNIPIRPSSHTGAISKEDELRAATQALRIQLPLRLLVNYSAGTFDDLMLATMLYIEELSGSKALSEYHVNHEEGQPKPLADQLRLMVPLHYLITGEDHRNRADILHEPSGTNVWRLDTVRAAIRYITALQREKSATPNTKATIAITEVGDMAHQKTDHSPLVIKKSTARHELFDVAIKPREQVTTAFVSQSSLGKDTIALLRRNNRAVIILVAGVWAARRRYLSQIANQIWSLPLDGVEAGYAHRNEWIAITFCSTEATEVGYRALSTTKFFSQDQLITTINIRRFDEFSVLHTNDAAPTQPEAEVDANENGKNQEENSNAHEAADAPILETTNDILLETTNDTLLETTNEDGDENSAGPELRRKERRLLKAAIPKSFLPKGREKATTKTLHAASMYIKCLKNRDAGSNNVLPASKEWAMITLRSLVPESYFKKSPGETDETDMFVAARTYITYLEQQCRDQDAAKKKSKESVSRASISSASRANDSTHRSEGIGRSLTTPTQASPSRKRPITTVDLTTPPANKAQKRRPESTPTGNGRGRSINDGAVAIKIPRNPSPERVPFRPGPTPTRSISGHQALPHQTNIPLPPTMPAATQPHVNTSVAPTSSVNTPPARQAAQAAPQATTSASFVPTTNTETAAVDAAADAALSCLDRLEDVVRERRAENVLHRALNKNHSTRGGNAMVENARQVIRDQKARIAELEGEKQRFADEKQRLQRRVRMLEMVNSRLEDDDSS